MSTPTRRPHVVVITRWQERYAEYARYLDHAAHAVTYVATDIARAAVPEAAAEVAVVRHTDHLEEVRTAVAGLVRHHGPPTRIVALKEDDLLVAASLRREFGVPGQGPDELIRFRDKYLMASAVSAAGLPVPSCEPAPDSASVLDFAQRQGWPLVVKPRIGSSSAGVVMLTGPEDIDRVDWTEPLLVQVANPHPIYHVDGVFDGTEVLCWRASRYVNTCLGFRDGTFLGSVEEDDPEVLRLVAEHTPRFLGALTSAPTPFHLEVFVDDGRATGAPSVEFLEVGARVGGAEIPFVWRDLHGYDLMEAAFRLQLGLPAGRPARPTGGRGAECGGWLLFPAPAARPCRVTEVTAMAGDVPGLYAESLLRPGEVLPNADAYYEHVGGRFRFRAADSATVRRAMARVVSGFRVAAEPLGDLVGADAG